MIQTFSTFASSIFLEGLFFLIIGAIISGVIEVMVSKETIASMIPSNRFKGLLIASLLGFIFPICECGIVPVVRRLLKKGVPLHMGVTLLFASPIVNIIVISSTFFAFPGNREIVIYRLIGGIVISFTAGLIVSFLPSETVKGEYDCDNNCGCSHHHHGENKENKLISIGNNAIEEFFDTGKYFIIGILITSLIQTTVPRQWINDLGSSYPLSHVFMLVLPYILSICSNTDAFIARSFLENFSHSAILCFLIFGAMFDIKTTIMLDSIFRRKFIVKLIVIVFILTLIYTSILEFGVFNGK